MQKRLQSGTNYCAGQAAEQIVARDYQRRGREVLRQRWRGRNGEIDLILQDGDGVIFAEVKKSRSHAQAALRLGARQMARIMAAGEEFLGTLPNGALTPARFDVALVDDAGRVEIIENALMGA